MSCGTFKGYITVAQVTPDLHLEWIRVHMRRVRPRTYVLRVDVHSQVGKDSAFPETDITELFTERRVCVRLYLLKVTPKLLMKCRMSYIGCAGAALRCV